MTDLLQLLEEISSDNPCGDNLEYDPSRVSLDSEILGTPENQFTGESAQPPDWRNIRKQAIDLLKRSKDLQVILYLVRAEINLTGWVGFRDGLLLLQQSLMRYWDSIHPQLDPEDANDPTMRINILEELSNYELSLRPLSQAYLVESRLVGRFSLRDIQYANDKLQAPEGVNKPDITLIKAAFQDIDVDVFNHIQQIINDCLQLLEDLESFLANKVGSSEIPNWSELKALIKEGRHAFQQFASDRLSGVKEPDMADNDLAEDHEEETPNTVKLVKKHSNTVASREDVTRMLDLICQYYVEHEPSSPVPILLRRAKYLVTADFVEIVHNLMPDGLSQLETIKGPDIP